ncbi:MAG: glycosyl hydrolase family 28-related protein [Rhodanobacter sp.]
MKGKDADLERRNLLRLGGMGLAAASVATVPMIGIAAQPIDVTGSGGYFLDVRCYGATGDGKAVDTPAINEAIAAAAAAGGGTVIIPAGTYMCFSIRLKSRVHLYLSAGAKIVGADSPRPDGTTGYHGGEYDPAGPPQPWEAYQDYGHNHWKNSLLWAIGEHDISISGPGVIYGKGLSSGSMGSRGGYPVFDQKQAGVADKAIAMKDCHNVILRDFSILKGGHFGMLLTGVDNLVIDNLTVDTERDGIDIDCCRNVKIVNTTVNSPWDDGICLKSSYALGYPRITKDIIITGCFVTGDFQLGSVIDGSWRRMPLGAHVDPHGFHAGRIKCGTESNGGFINIAITNCIFDGCMGYALESVDGALLEDITISNSTMRNLYCGPLFLRLGARLRGPKATTQVGKVRRIFISNLDCYATRSDWCSTFSGIPGYDIEDVKLSNIYIEVRGGEKNPIPAPPKKIADYPEPTMFGVSPAYGFFIQHLKNIDVSHLELAVRKRDVRPAFYMDHVTRADFFAVTAPRGPTLPFSLHDVRDFRIGWSRATPDKDIADAGATSL